MMQPIVDIYVWISDRKWEERDVPDGWDILDKDLNKGLGGKFIYIFFKRLQCHTETQRRITDIQVFASDHEHTGIHHGWEIIPGDLNKGAGGKYVYLGVKRGGHKYGITMLDVHDSDHHRDGWFRNSTDLNSGAGGEYRYLYYRTPHEEHLPLYC
ncbi:hypothetical protein HK103_001358 [Boothiomyces macroporosus]|uniref:MABP domain-containing protein n=1 Tax=Boothiomyces macroporosus TaxID=261099 RepID=A0AAD5Y5D7_9FUNG|nr:hypothetical protein HK103_001358 [Boothiomyces macroporosus]